MINIQVADKTFAKFIDETLILNAVKHMSERMTKELADKDPVFIGIMNGVFMFASDLLKNFDFPCQVSFIKASSYKGTQSTGNVTPLIGLNIDIRGKTVIILEDIVDTGLTVETVYNQLLTLKPAEIKVAAFLLKPLVYKKNIKIDYIGMEIPNNFIVGYGLDYNGYGRNLKNIYTLE